MVEIESGVEFRSRCLGSKNLGSHAAFEPVLEKEAALLRDEEGEAAIGSDWADLERHPPRPRGCMNEWPSRREVLFLSHSHPLLLRRVFEGI